MKEFNQYIDEMRRFEHDFNNIQITLHDIKIVLKSLFS